MLMEGRVRWDELVLNVPLMSKARPRSMAGRSVPYMPPAYKKWKKEVRAQMAEWWVDEPLELVYLVRMTFKGPQRQDLDNLLGAVLDAGNNLIWKDDRVSVISRLVGEHQKAKTTEQQIVLKLIYPDK